MRILKIADSLVAKLAYTLVEMVVVITIIVILLLLTFPSIRAMQAASGRAEAYNTINAALQAARSYAIMHGVNTAARFQPNGKIFLVYKVDNSHSFNAEFSDSSTGQYPEGGVPTPENIIYLPVINQKPLVLPNNYSVSNSPQTDTFDEPFYVCYKPDGTLSVSEKIWVGLTDDQGKLINPDFNSNGQYCWNTTPPNSTNYSDVTNFATDSTKIQDSNDRKLARYYCVIVSGDYAGSNPTEAEKKKNDADHYGGDLTLLPPESESVKSISLFKVPDNWGQMPIYSSSGNNDRATYVNNLDANQFETIYLNPYTGRVIRPVK